MEHEDFRRSGFRADLGSFYHFKVQTGTFSSNLVVTAALATDHGPKTSCIDFGGDHEDWAAIFIGSSTTFSNNQGVVTNDIYFGNAATFVKINNIKWTGSIKSTSETKLAQFFYKPAGNSF